MLDEKQRRSIFNSWAEKTEDDSKQGEEDFSVSFIEWPLFFPALDHSCNSYNPKG